MYELDLPVETANGLQEFMTPLLFTSRSIHGSLMENG